MFRRTVGKIQALFGLVALCLALCTPAVAFAASPDVVISQVYGGGGNTGATYKNDFIELYNRGSTPVSLNGWSVQYASATGSSWQVTSLTNVTLQPGQYYLVREAAGAGGTASLPTPDATGSISMSSTAGKVALVTSTTALSCGAACATNAAVRDYVGFGTTANNYEGSGPTAAPSNTLAVLRAGNGATDTDSNVADFATGAPNPRNTLYQNTVNGACGASNGQTLAAATPPDLCTAGTASSVSGTGHPWSWSCAGTNGGTTASCSATIQSYSLAFATDGNGSLTGATAQTVDYAQAATSITAVGNSGYSFQNWTGPNGFTSTANPLTVSNVTVAGTYTAHFSSAVVNGTCGSDNGLTLAATAPTNLCSTGTSSSVTGSGHPWNWSCTGANGGSTASCSASIKTYTLTFAADSNGSLSGTTTQTVDHGASATPVTATANESFSFVNWTGTNGFTTSTTNPLTVANVTASQAITAHFKGGFTVFHMNDAHARLTPHKGIIAQHGTAPAVFEDIGGAAYLAGKLLSLTSTQPTALVLDGGDISEGNPIGDMNGNQSMTSFYAMLSNKLKAVAGRGGRGIDAMVVGNHDLRDATYVANMEQLRDSGVPVISVNVRDVATHLPHFAPYTIVTVNGTKVGILGYTTSSAQVGASLTSSLEVVDCDWKGTAACHIADYVNELRNVQGCDVVILLTHNGHSDLVDPVSPVIADTADANVPEIAVTGHWHTWTDTVWQPASLNYKTIFTESASYMKYIGELRVTGTGKYVSTTQHPIRNADITPDADVQAFVSAQIAQYNAAHPGHPVDEVVGYTDSDLTLDNDMRWWSPNEYPWSGNNTAGQWITDAMQWKAAQIFGQCDLAFEVGGGVRADIPAGPVTYLQVYETFPWVDDYYYRINMTGQDIVNFLKTTNLNAGFSKALEVTAFDGIPTIVKINGQPVDLNHTYTVAINNYMYAHPPAGYTWPDTAPLTSTVLVRDSLVEYMTTQHGTPATAYQTGGARYHFNGEYAGGYLAVVTMMDDKESKPTFDKAFVRLVSATPETLARRGTRQVPADLVNADGSINQANRLAEQELYRSYLGFKDGALKKGDIIEIWGKAGFYHGNPEFVDQEGVYGDGVEFKIVGHDESLAAPTVAGSISDIWNDQYKNHYVQFLAKKVGTDTVSDQYGQTIKIWDATGYNTTALALPGNVGDTLLITGVPTMENYALRFRRDTAVVSATPLPAVTVSSRVESLPASAGSAVTLNATTKTAGTYYLNSTADAQVASGKPTSNYGASTSMYVQSSSTSSYGDERAWVKFDLSGLPAGLSVTGATLQLWDFKATGAALPAEVRGGSSDTWTEAAITWNTQPDFGSALSTQTLAAGAKDIYYNWDVGSFVQQKFAGNKLVSLVVKAVTEGSTDTTAPAYAFDAKEYGSNGPVLQVQTLGTIASVRFFYRFSPDNTTWGAWTQHGAALTAAPYQLSFTFPNGNGYYQFYSIATDSQGNTEAAPTVAQASVQYTAAAAQTISFGALSGVTVGTSVPVSATASSGLPVVFSSQTTTICTVIGNTVTMLAAGTCSIAADQAGNATWAAAATVVQSFTVSRATQTISFASIGSQTLDNSPLAVNPTASSGLAVSLTSQTPAVCSVSGNSVTLLTSGTCTLKADQAGNASYDAAASVSQSFNVTSAVVTADAADVPLPLWALALLATGVLGAAKRRGLRLH